MKSLADLDEHKAKFGGEQYRGPNKGEAIVNTVTLAGFARACPNIGRFLDNYDWTAEEQSLAMEYVTNQDMELLAAGKKVIREHPGMLDRWFGISGIDQTGGINTADGEGNPKQIAGDALGL